jgi:hypothetical protein
MPIIRAVWRRGEYGHRSQGGDAEGLRTDAEEEPAGGHHREGGAGGREGGAEEADAGRPEHRAPGAQPVDHDPANQDQDDVGEAVDGVQQADLCVAEVKLALEQVGDRADRVVDVVVPEARERDERHGEQAYVLARGGVRWVWVHEGDPE